MNIFNKGEFVISLGVSDLVLLGELFNFGHCTCQDGDGYFVFLGVFLKIIFIFLFLKFLLKCSSNASRGAYSVVYHPDQAIGIYKGQVQDY